MGTVPGDQAAIDGPSGAELEAAARASHAAADHRRSLDAYEAAFGRYRAEGDLVSAARAARTIGWLRGWVFGEWAVYQGWSGRALSLLERIEDDSAVGWRLCEEARRGDDLEVQRGKYLESIELARRAGDDDLECEATASLGIMLVFSGLVSEGMELLDRALAAICGGGVQELSVLEGCLCGLLNACERTQDVDRADQWLRAAEPVIRRGNLVAVGGHCRAHYAGILLTAGRYDEAEVELRRSIELLAGRTALHGSALCRLADLRLRQGRLEEAEGLLAGLEQHDDAIVPLTRLQLALGRPRVAVELIDRHLSVAGRPDHIEGPLQAAAVEAHLALGAVDAAARCADRLADLASEHTAPGLRGLAAIARAELCTATGTGDPRSCWHEALAHFASARMPLEGATARLELARHHAEDQPELAISEAALALKDLAALGALRMADDAAGLLRALGAPSRSGPRRDAVLTKREEEVLGLLGHGLSNSEIGARLFISPKTVEHHVGRVLAKLGVRSRTEAAVHAARAGNGGRS